MRDDHFHQPLRQPATTMFRQDEHVGEPSERRIVRDDARESDLVVAFVDAERERVFDRTFDHVARAASRPIRVVREIVVNQLEVEARAISADLVITALPSGELPLSLGEGWGEGLRRIHFLFFFLHLPPPSPYLPPPHT